MTGGPVAAGESEDVMDKGTCKHFNGTRHNKTCAAGVCYAEVTPEWDRRDGVMLRIPCHTELGLKHPSPGQLEEFAKRGTCPKYEELTAEDLAAHKATVQKVVQRMAKIIPLVSEVKREHKGKSWQGTKPCPICGGTLHLTHAAFNGHVWGKCETEDCVSWMEYRPRRRGRDHGGGDEARDTVMELTPEQVAVLRDDAHPFDHVGETPPIEALRRLYDAVCEADVFTDPTEAGAEWFAAKIVAGEVVRFHAERDAAAGQSQPAPEQPPKHNPRAGPCPTCGCQVTESVSPPFVIEDDEQPTDAAASAQDHIFNITRSPFADAVRRILGMGEQADDAKVVAKLHSVVAALASPPPPVAPGEPRPAPEQPLPADYHERCDCGGTMWLWNASLVYRDAENVVELRCEACKKKKPAPPQPAAEQGALRWKFDDGTGRIIAAFFYFSDHADYARRFGEKPAAEQPAAGTLAALAAGAGEEKPTDFKAWWERDGRYYDPDTEDVPWYDKRKELAEHAFDAGAASRSPCPRRRCRAGESTGAGVTPEQRKLKEKHGTPEEFWQALNAAADDLMITTAEAVAGYHKYKSEWDAAADEQEVRK